MTTTNIPSILFDDHELITRAHACAQHIIDHATPEDRDTIARFGEKMVAQETILHIDLVGFFAAIKQSQTPEMKAEREILKIRPSRLDRFEGIIARQVHFLVKARDAL